MAIAAIGWFMVTLDALVVVTALPTIQHDVGGSIPTLQWIVSAYLLTFGAAIITASTLGDKYGRRSMFAVGLALFAAASAACALSPTITILIVARGVQGLGAAFIAPLSLSLVSVAVPPERRGAAIGMLGGIGGAGVAGGPLVGGAIAQGLNWHWIFWINVPIGAIAAALAVMHISESRGADAKFDLPGAALVTTASLALLWALVRGNSAGWTSLEVLSSGLAGAILLAAFVCWEQRAAAPMIPLRLFRDRTFAAANVVAFLGMGSLFAAALFMTEYFQTVLGFSPVAAGLRFLPWTATPLIIAPIAGRLVNRVGARALLTIGLALQAVGIGVIAYLATPTTAYSSFILPFIVSGVGISMVLPATPVAVLGAVPRHEIGMASGVMNSLQRFGGSFVVALASTIFVANDPAGSAQGFMEGLRPALEVSIVLSVVGAAVALAVSRPAPPTAGGSQPSVPASG